MLKDEVGQLDSTINTIRLIIYKFN
jgi:hypothetical protein